MSSTIPFSLFLSFVCASPCSRPATSFLWFTSPLKTFKFIIWKYYKWHIIFTIIVILLIVLLVIFIYTAPVGGSGNTCLPKSLDWLKYSSAVCAYISRDFKSDFELLNCCKVCCCLVYLYLLCVEHHHELDHIKYSARIVLRKD